MTSVRRMARRVLPKRVDEWLSRQRTAQISGERLSGRESVGSGKSEPSVEHIIALETMLFSTADHTYAKRLATSVGGLTKGSDAHGRATLALARWSFHEGRPEDALRYLDEVHPGDNALRVAVDLCRVDCLCELRDRQAAMSLLSRIIGRDTDEQNLVLRVGHARSLVDGPKRHGSGPMVEALNIIYHGSGFGMLRRTLVIAPIGLDNVSCEVPDAEPMGSLPRVTVLVRVPDGSADIVGLSSLLRQSWRDLEIVVVTGSKQRERLSALDPALIDDRVRYVDSSDGPHPLRAALARGTGEMITIHQHDSWAHPQRVEAQASVLMANPLLRGTISAHMCVAEELRPRPLGLVPQVNLVGPNPSSMMLRRADTVSDEILAEFARVKVNHFPLTDNLSMSDDMGLVNDGIPLTLSKASVASTKLSEKAWRS